MNRRALGHWLCWVFSILLTISQTTLLAQIQEKGEPDPGDTRWMKVIRGKYQKTDTQPSARPADKARAQKEPRREVNEKDLQTVKAEEASGTMLGITLWRMRPATEEDEVQLETEEQLVTPVRVKSDTPLREGDRIRITVESPRKGYLYVIDREQYTDDSMGRPQLIFPTQRLLDGENAVNESVLLTVPGTDDNPPFFTLKRSGPEHKAEVVTVLVSAERLPLRD